MTYTVPAGRYSDTSADFIQAYIDQSIQDLVGASPESLDTLQELADALGDNPDAINDLVANLQAEIARAQAAEEALQAELNAEEAASAAYDVQQDNRISVLEIVNEINKKDLSYITLIGSASPAAGQVGVNSFTPSAISMIVLPKTDADGKTIVASDFLEGDRIGLKQTNGSAAIYFVLDSFDFGDHVRMNVDDTSTVLGAAGDQLFVENDSVNAVFEDTSVTRAAATAGFTTASDARAILQGLIDALEARADALELDPTTQTAVDTINSALSARLDTLEADPTTATAVAAVQADVDQNESDADAAIALKLNIANPTATGDLTVDTQTRLEFDGNITKLHNDLRSTRLDIGNNITVYPAAAGGRFEIEGGLYIRVSDLVQANNDSDAETAGVIVGGVYYDGNGHLKIRVS